MNKPPHQYQTIATRYILRKHKCSVFASMGMGKTRAVLDAFLDVLMADDYTLLVVGPKRVANTTWPDEIEKWDHLSHLAVSVILGGVVVRKKALKRKADIYTINYENLPWLISVLGDKWPFNFVVLDESTHIKSLRPSVRTNKKTGKKFAVILGAKRGRGLAMHRYNRKIEFLVNLSGTPAPNGLQDLYGPQWMVDLGRALGASFSNFAERWFVKDEYRGVARPHKHSPAEIQERLKSTCLTLDAKDWFDVDEPIIRNIEVDVPPAVRALYNDMQRKMFIQLKRGERIKFKGENAEDGIKSVEAFSAADRNLKCLQIANGAIYTDKSCKTWEVLHDAKLDALESIFEEAAGMPILVAYHFKHDLARILARFKFARVLDDKPITQRDWNDGHIAMLVAHPASAGHGLNLQDGGNILVFMGHWYDLEKRLQIIERIGPVRQLQSGHDRAVFIYNIVLKNSLDQVVIARTNSKKSVQDCLLDAMKDLEPDLV